MISHYYCLFILKRLRKEFFFCFNIDFITKKRKKKTLQCSSGSGTHRVSGALLNVVTGQLVKQMHPGMRRDAWKDMMC